MRSRNSHLSDRDLMMAVDGELPQRESEKFAAHIEACEECRRRLRSMKATMADFVTIHHDALSQELGYRALSDAGPRAMLRARMAEATRPTTPATAWQRGIWRAIPAGGAFLMAMLAVVLIFQVTVNAEGPKPKAGLTPGETRPITLSEICSKPEADVVSYIPDDVRKKVFSEYGVSDRTGKFEVDYLITPDLGGTQSLRNLWPQPYSVRWNAHVKDRLEQRLHDLVCAGKLDLPTAQRDIAVDWISAYRKYVGDNARR